MQSPSTPCYIHIGAPKTGTTYLQKYLAENRDKLLSRGVLYPDVSLRGYGHHDIAFLLTGGYPSWATPQQRTLADLKPELTEAVSRHSGSIVLSSENFYLYPEPQKLLALLEECGILKAHCPKIVVYLRRQDEAHESWYNQTIKAQGYTHTLEECIDRFADLWDYHKQLEGWTTTFGRENIIVRIFEKNHFVGGSLLSEFLHQVNMSTEGLKIADGPVNAGLNRDAIEFQRLVNALPLTPQQKRQFHRELIDLSVKTAGMGIFDESPLLDPTQRDNLLEAYRESNEYVASTFFGMNRLFMETGKASDHKYRKSKGLTPEKLALLLAWILSNRKVDP